MTKTLYITGNGFDLHHGLKTSYYDFAEYLKENDSHLYYLLESHLSYPQTDEELWKRFEENLANLDVDSVLSDNVNYLPNIASDEFRDRDLHAFPDLMDDILRNLTTDLIAVFTQFIRAITIPRSALEYKISIDKDANFFSFNYTATLEQLYQINSKNILFIHNSAYDKYENIVLGHGIDPEKFKERLPNPPDDLSAEELENWYGHQNDNWDYSYDTGKENLINYFLNFYKPTKEIIARNQLCFQSLYNTDEVFVFGHSLSEIDIPYFVKIAKSIHADAKWTISFYNEKEKEHHMQSIIDIGVPKVNIKMVELEELQLKNNQMKLNF